MEWKIGEIRQIDGEWYQCIESHFSCKGCDFKNTSRCSHEGSKCSYPIRQDRTSVIFKKLEKIRGPYDDYGTILQRFKIYTNVTNADTKGLELHIYSNDTIGIEIKENKEDMEERNDNRYDGRMDEECITLCDILNSLPGVETTSSCCGHCKNDFMIFFNCNNSYSLAVISRVFDKRYSGTYLEWKIEVETLDNGRYCYFLHSIKPYSTKLEMKTDVEQLMENLEFWKAEEHKEYFNYKGEEEQPNTEVPQEVKRKPFCLKDAKSGKPVCTRSGKKARIVCFDAKGILPIIALVESGDEEKTVRYSNSGRFRFDGTPDEEDLMMLSEKKEGWINVYDNRCYSTKEEAMENKDPYAYYMTTVKVSWEE